MADVGNLALRMSVTGGTIVQDAKALATRAGAAARQGFGAVSGGQLGGIAGAFALGGFGGSFGGRAGFALGEIAGPWAAATAAVTAFGYAAVAAVRRTIDEVSALVDQADQLGVTFNSLVGVQHAGSLVGVSLQEASRSMEFLQRNIGQAALGTGEARNALEQLNISALELSRLPADQQLKRIVDALAAVEDRSRRAALAQQLFGRGSRSVMRLIAQGEGFLGGGAREAHELGLTLIEGQERAIDDLGDALTRLQAAGTGAWRQLTAALAPLGVALVNDILPSVTALIATFRDLRHQVESLRVSGEALGIAWRNFGIGQVVETIRHIRQLTGSQGVIEETRPMAADSTMSQVDSILQMLQRQGQNAPRGPELAALGTARAVELSSRFATTTAQGGGPPTREQLEELIQQAELQRREQEETRLAIENFVRHAEQNFVPAGGGAF